MAFRSVGGEAKSDENTPLSGRVTIGEDFTLTITSVQPSDELVFYCQVTAGPAGVGDAPTMLKVFRESASALWPFIRPQHDLFKATTPPPLTFPVVDVWNL